MIFLAFETASALPGVDVFITSWNKSYEQIAKDVSSATSASSKRCLLLIDSLTTLCQHSIVDHPKVDLAQFLMFLLQPIPPDAPAITSLVAVYHEDITLRACSKNYTPNPLSLLRYLATTIMRVHSLPILLAERQAQERSLGAPSFGLSEQKEGLVIGSKRGAIPIPLQHRGFAIELEHRRKSGRGVLEWYFLPYSIPSKANLSTTAAYKEIVSLLVDHPLLKQTDIPLHGPASDVPNATFELSLTERQRLERDGVVLPYFDAQKAGGGLDGGRILYDMGSEDDFDEEEDEI